MISQITVQKRSIRKFLRIRPRKPLKIRTTSEEELFLHSKPLEDAYPKPVDSFTIMPCRVPLQDDVMRTVVRHLYDDETLMQIINKGTVQSSIASLDSPIGHFVTLVFPECLPQRLEMVTYVMETGTLFDDVLEDDSYAAVKEDVGSALMAVKFTAGESPRKATIQKWMAKNCLEMVNLYGKEGRVLLQNCQSSWLDEWATDAGIQATRFEDYLSQSIRNFAIPALWATTAFSLGVLLTPGESKLIQPLTDIATRIIIQTNDYFSWEVDRIREKNRIFNGIPCLMREHHISEEQAKSRLKSYIMQDEQMYESMLERFYKTHPNLPIHLRKYIAACALCVGGNHHWSAVCSRYNLLKVPDWEQLPEEIAERDAVSVEPGLKSIEIDDLCTLDPTSNKTPSLKAIDEADLNSSALLAAPRYIQSLSSKNIRSKLIDAFNIWFQLPEDRVSIIKGVINDLHNATLILDDIQDESILRRGSSAAHCIFGPAQCINSATYMVVQAATRIHEHHPKTPETMGVFLDGLTKLSIGQSWDLNWKSNLYCPSTAEYMKMIDGKTGAMFKMLVHMMKSMSFSQQWPVANFDRFAQLLGRLYQVRDDFQNLQDPEYTEQKGFCEDLDEGKLSYPVVLTCNSEPIAREIILGIFRRKGNGTQLARSVKIQILNLIQKAGSLEKTWQLVQQLEKEVEDTLSALETALGEPNESLRLITKLLSNIPPP